MTRPHSTWKCPKCKAEVDAGFDVCWACGTDSDGTPDPDFVIAAALSVDANHVDAPSPWSVLPLLLFLLAVVIYGMVELSFPLPVILAAAAVLHVGSAAWAITDAQKRGYSGDLVLLLVVLLGPIGVVLWLVVRPKSKVVIRPPAEYANPEDAVAAAVQLEMQSDLDAAIALYREVARRWPEHENYVRGCITRLEEKRLQA